MRTASREDVISVIGDGYSDPIINSWLDINVKFFTASNGTPFGLVGDVYSEDDKTTFIASTATDHDLIFNYEMLKYILNINTTNHISVITDMPEYRERIMDALGPHGFKFEVINDIMYSRRNKTQKDKLWEQ